MGDDQDYQRRGGKELNTMNTFYDLYFAQSFQNGASTAEPFQQELDNPVGEVCKEHEGETKLFVFVSVFVFVFVFLITCKEHEGEASEKPKSATKLGQKGLKRVKLHLRHLILLQDRLKLSTRRGQ